MQHLAEVWQHTARKEIAITPGGQSHMPLGSQSPISSFRHPQSLAVRSLRAFPITDTELKLMAAAAIMFCRTVYRALEFMLA